MKMTRGELRHLINEMLGMDQNFLNPALMEPAFQKGKERQAKFIEHERMATDPKTPKEFLEGLAFIEANYEDPEQQQTAAYAWIGRLLGVAGATALIVGSGGTVATLIGAITTLVGGAMASYDTFSAIFKRLFTSQNFLETGNPEIERLLKLDLDILKVLEDDISENIIGMYMENVIEPNLDKPFSTIPPIRDYLKDLIASKSDNQVVIQYKD